MVIVLGRIVVRCAKIVFKIIAHFSFSFNLSSWMLSIHWNSRDLLSISGGFPARNHGERLLYGMYDYARGRLFFHENYDRDVSRLRESICASLRRLSRQYYLQPASIKFPMHIRVQRECHSIAIARGFRNVNLLSID